MKFRCVIICFLLIICYCFCQNIILAGDETPSWWQVANGWGTPTDIGDIFKPLENITGLVSSIGNMVFIAVTVILGVKYIWGGVDSKASVKDSLITLVVAALVFYGWNSISALINGGGKLFFMAETPQGTAANIYSTILYVCNFLAVGGIVYIGIKYMMAGAEGKSQLKAKGVPIVLGIIMVYATVTFLNLIVGIL